MAKGGWMAGEGEVIIICIDNTIGILDYYRAQIEAIKSYATYVIQSHPRTHVGLSTMNYTPFLPTRDFALDPTRDLDKILNTLQNIQPGRKFHFVETVSNCMVLFYYGPEKMQKRMVMFAGGNLSMSIHAIEAYANLFKYHGVALDVVNFTLGDIHGFRKRKLEAFVAAVNNSRIIHVEEHESSLSSLLYSFMDKGMKNKDHQLIHSMIFSKKKKSKKNENVDVKRESEPPSCKGATTSYPVPFCRDRECFKFVHKFKGDIFTIFYIIMICIMSSACLIVCC